MGLFNLVFEMAVLTTTFKAPQVLQPQGFFSATKVHLNAINGFIQTVSQGELIGAEEQLDEFQRLLNPTEVLQVAIRHAETLLKAQLFFQGIQASPIHLWEDEEKEFLTFLTTRMDPACSEIEKTSEKILSYLQMKRKSVEVSTFVGDLLSFSQKIVDLQSSGVALSSEEMGVVGRELSALQGRVQGLQWRGKKDALNQIGKLEHALPTLAAPRGVFRWISSKLCSPKSKPVGATPIGIPNEGNSCFLASAVQLILLNPVLEEALIQDWIEGGAAREFGEFLFNYREAQKNGQGMVAGIGKLRDALCRLSGNPEFDARQWDANEVLRTLISDERSALFQRLEQKGFFLTESVRRYYEPPMGKIPLEGGDLLYDPEIKAYYSERKTLRPAQIEVEISASDKDKPLIRLIDAVWTSSLDGSDPGHYEMQDGKKEPCKPLVQEMCWSNVAPKTLTVSLKRWAYAGAGVKVDVPIAIAEVEKIPIGKSEVSMRLVGFMSHSGSTSGGHWISYFANNGVYTCNNDSQISSIAREEFLLQAGKASDLFYKLETASTTD